MDLSASGHRSDDAIHILYATKMTTTRIEVFIERNCKSCYRVISLLKRLRADLTIFERERDKRLFSERNVLIVPATFIDGRLAFYGEFTEEEFINHPYIRTHK